MHKAVTVVSMLASVAFAHVAQAAPVVHFDANGPTPSSYFAFDIVETPKPDSFTSSSFTIKNVTTTNYNTAYGFDVFKADITFTVADTKLFPLGGFSLSSVDYRSGFYGAQLFSGVTSAPTFKIGSFDVAEEYIPWVVTISAGATAAPEPATWALLIVGFGGIGIALRRRVPGSSITYHQSII